MPPKEKSLHHPANQLFSSEAGELFELNILIVLPETLNSKLILFMHV